jgi:hypothetical protein
VDRQLIVGEDTVLWLLRGDLKGETGSEIIAAEIRHCKPNIMRQNITNRNREQMQSVNNLMRQWNGSYRHVQ